MNAFELIAMKQKVSREYADEVELFVLAHFDAAKRGKLGPIGYNFVSRHLVQAQYIFARLKNPERQQLVRLASEAWLKAGARPTDTADLTTQEYTAMRGGLKAYFRALPQIEAGTYRQAVNIAEQVMR
jgi:hypothetical protein